MIPLGVYAAKVQIDTYARAHPRYTPRTPQGSAAKAQVDIYRPLTYHLRLIKGGTGLAVRCKSILSRRYEGVPTGH